MGNMLPLVLMIIACLLALALVIMALRRINQEGLTVSSSAEHKHFVRSVEEVKRKHEQAHIVATLTGDQDGSIELNYTRLGFGKVVDSPIENAVARVEAGLKREGMQIVEKIDLNKMLEREGEQPYFVIVFCHKPLAVAALASDPTLGLLTFSSVIRKDLSDNVHVEFTDPVRCMESVRLMEPDSAALGVKDALTRILATF